MKRHLPLYALAIIGVLSSCQKGLPAENSNTSIDGAFTLKYFAGKSNSTVTSTSGEKTITTLDYATANTQGLIVLNNQTLTAKGISYSIDSEIKGYIYDGANLLDSLTYPFSFTLPASNSVAQYQLIGADSIYFPNGSVTTGVGGTGLGGGTTQSVASGGRYSWSGNELTIIQSFFRDSSFTDSGETIHLRSGVVASTVLQKL